MKRLLLLILLMFYSSNIFAAQLLLPFSGGEPWRCDQGNGDCDTTHCINNSMRYAWDFNYGSGSDDLGKPVFAPAAGKVVYAKNSSSKWGNVVIIDYGDTNFGKIAHLDTIDVVLGQTVVQGQKIGTCGGTGGWPSHIHYQTQENNTLEGESKQSIFIDAESSDGIPKAGKYYISLNTPNPYNNFRIGKFSNGWHLEPNSYTNSATPYSRPFVLTYFNNGGLSNLGWPSDNVHLLNSYEISGYNVYGAPACYIQNIRNSSSGDPWVTLVLNPYVYNDRLKYLGIVFPIHGQIRSYWRLNYSQFGPPICNEYEEWVNGSKYVVQWFEPSDNVFRKITYNTANGNFNDAASSSLTYGNHLNQSAWKNIGCSGADCGVGGGALINPPTDLFVDVIDDFSLQLAWTLPSTADGQYLRIYLNGSIYKTIYVENYRNIASLIIEDIVPNTRYCFQLSLADSLKNESEKTSLVCVVSNYVEEGTELMAPSSISLEGVPTKNYVKLFWQSSGFIGVNSGVELFRNGVLLKFIPGISSGYIDEAPVCKGENNYKIRIRKESAYSGFSAPLKVLIKLDKVTGVKIN